MTSAHYPDTPGTAGLSGEVDPPGTNSGSAGGPSARSGPSYDGGTSTESPDPSLGAKEQAQQAAATATDEGKHLAEVAQSEAQNITGEAKNQAMILIDDAKSQLDDHSRHQRDRLVETLRTFGDDLERMAGQSNGGMATDLVRQVARRARELTNRLDGREPREIVDDVRAFARRKPGTFLLGSLAAGAVAGRMARGAKSAMSSTGSRGATSPSTTGQVAPAQGRVPEESAGPLVPGETAADPLPSVGSGTPAGATSADWRPSDDIQP
jgi:hypothetical protein